MAATPRTITIGVQGSGFMEKYSKAKHDAFFRRLCHELSIDPEHVTRISVTPEEVSYTTRIVTETTRSL